MYDDHLEFQNGHQPLLVLYLDVPKELILTFFFFFFFFFFDTIDYLLHMTHYHQSEKCLQIRHDMTTILSIIEMSK